MNKKLILLLPLCVLSLSSCITVDKRFNIIVPGYFRGVNDYDESISCDLTINEITEEEYINYDGVNVIKDAINGKCYTIEFNITYNDGLTENITFVDFEDALNGATASPVWYVDSNDWWFYPITDSNLSYSDCYYSVYSSNPDSIQVSTYVYASEE